MASEGSPRTQLGLALLTPHIVRFKEFLAKLGESGRIDLVERARSTTDWPDAAWLERHWLKHWGRVRSAAEYAEWATAIMNTDGTEVWAFVHLSTWRPGLAFVNHQENAVVWFDAERMQIVSAFYPDEGTAAFLRGKDHDYWRLKETEI